jgi:hypothetical protein
MGMMDMDALTDELSRSLLRLDKKHRYLLQWFFDHNGEMVPWSDLIDPEFRLANRAKGIYRPKGLDYALSVKQTLKSPYTDSQPRPTDNGGWTYRYHEESSGTRDAATLATNRGLEHCMADRVPVGVLIQASPKPHVTYKVWGLAMVRAWTDGFFTLEGRHALSAEIVSFGEYAETRARKAAEGREPYGALS